jgi:hypothetical protein
VLSPPLVYVVLMAAREWAALKPLDASEIFVVLVGKLVVVPIAGTVLSRGILFSPPKDMPLPIFMFLGSSVYRAEEGAGATRPTLKGV